MLTDKQNSSESLMRVPCALWSGVDGYAWTNVRTGAVCSLFGRQWQCLDDRVRCHAICVKCVLTRRSVCGCGSERVLVWQRTHLCFVIVIVPALR
jgi:hypothetical protein